MVPCFAITCCSCGVRGSVVKLRTWNRRVPDSILGHGIYMHAVCLINAPQMHCLLLANRLIRLSHTRKQGQCTLQPLSHVIKWEEGAKHANLKNQRSHWNWALFASLHHLPKPKNINLFRRHRWCEQLVGKVHMQFGRRYDVLNTTYWRHCVHAVGYQPLFIVQVVLTVGPYRYRYIKSKCNHTSFISWHFFLKIGNVK